MIVFFALWSILSSGKEEDEEIERLFKERKKENMEDE